MAAYNPRVRNGNARRKLIAWLKAQSFPCALCGQPINYGLPAKHPDSFECDEVVPVSRYWLRLYNTQQHCWAGPYATAEQAALARGNVQASHRKCNLEKSNKIISNENENQKTIFRSRQW